MTTVYTVSTDLGNHADALALRELIRELGFEAELHHHELDLGPRSPCRDTRLGRMILRHMTPDAGTSPKTFPVESIAAMLEENDYNALSASPALSMLCKQGDVVRVSTGIYRRVMPIEQAS